MENSGFTVFCVDDEVNILNAYKRTLHKEIDSIHCFEKPKEALRQTSEQPPDLVILDLQMPELTGHEVLKQIKEIDQNINVIVISGNATVQDTVSLIKNGADDVLEKPVSNAMLVSRVQQFRKIWELEKETAELRKILFSQFEYGKLVGNSESMMRLKQTILSVGPSDLSVLIQGHTGTGKELVARALHAHSSRRDAPFVVVDCGAINESTIESELFGYRKGAFTGATEAHDGLVKEADGGTLFLDEIGELPLLLQTKLLRVLQEQEIRPVGASKSTSVNVRFLAASNRDILAASQEGTFREDLYFRLSTITVNIAALKDRADDIPLLVRHFIDLYGEENQHHPVTDIEAEALKYLINYDWPGNVREMENVIRRAIVFSATARIELCNLPENITSTEQAFDKPEESAESAHSIRSYEQKAIEEALEQTGGNRKKAAALLGISEATLYRKLKQK